MLVFVCFVYYLAVASAHGIQEESFRKNIMNEITALKTRQNSCDKKVSELQAVVDELQRQNYELKQEILEIRDDMVY
jgi:peptidoglycan hydrolase CwlO-like protein